MFSGFESKDKSIESNIKANILIALWNGKNKQKSVQVWPILKKYCYLINCLRWIVISQLRWNQIRSPFQQIQCFYLTQFDPFQWNWDFLLSNLSRLGFSVCWLHLSCLTSVKSGWQLKLTSFQSTIDALEEVIGCPFTEDQRKRLWESVLFILH